MGFFNLFAKSKQKSPSKKDHPIEFVSSRIAPLPKRVDSFQAEHIRVLKRLNRHPVNDPFSGMLAVVIDIPRFTKILLKLKLVKIAPYEESLYLLKNTTLKSILKKLNLKVSGNKAELVQRILDNADSHFVKRMEEYSACYVVTEKGNEVISAFYQKQEEELQSYRLSMVNMIESGNIEQAYKAICKHNADKVVQPGLCVDWEQRYEDGIPLSLLQLYNKQLRISENRHATAYAIYSHISGDSLGSNPSPDLEKIAKEASFQNKLMCTQRDLDSYKKANISEYRFLATLDDKTCPVCGKLDGQIFPVSKAKIGVNCPPMHLECRCTTISVVNRAYIAKMKRSARNPLTREAYTVPASTTYEEWIKTFH